jgi:general stress protein 26
MVTTHDIDGEMRSRPLTLIELEDDATMWFFIERRSELARDVADEARISATFADTADSWYVAVAGSAYVVHDPQKVEALWTPLATAWFPDGPHDRSLGLLRVDVDHVEYWKPGAGGKLMQFASIAKAALTRERAKNEGEHGSFAP